MLVALVGILGIVVFRLAEARYAQMKSPVPIAQPTAAQQLPLTAQIVLDQEVIILEVAQTPEQKLTGLMFRPEPLAENRGMFFPVTPPQLISTWMKNVQHPLDMVFLRAGRVVHLLPNTPACQSSKICPFYSSQRLADGLLELRAGSIDRLNLRPGSEIRIEVLEKKEVLNQSRE